MRTSTNSARKDDTNDLRFETHRDARADTKSEATPLVPASTIKGQTVPSENMEYESSIADAIKTVNAIKSEKIGMSDEFKGMELFSKEAIQGFDRLNPSLKGQASVNALIACTTFFRLGDRTHSSAGNANADKDAFLAAVKNVTGEKVEKVLGLTTPIRHHVPELSSWVF